MPSAVHLCALCLMLICVLPPQNTQGASAPGQPPAVLLKDSLEPTRWETASEALADWCLKASAKPPLVLISQNPFLQPLPVQMREQAIELVRSCEPGRIVPSASSQSPNPLILPDMILSAAMEAGLFSEVFWVFPFDQEEKSISVEAFRQQLIDSGVASDSEARSFIEQGDSLSGTLRGLPVHAIPSNKLSPIRKAALVHMDMSFFPPLYRNEIKSPLHPMIYRTLNRLRLLELTPVSVSLTTSNIEGGLPLSSRFIAGMVTTLIRNPEGLDSAPPFNWARHSEALYLESFFQNEKSLSLYLELDASRGSDAAIKYALYQNFRRLQKGTEALAYLNQATNLDPVYALEYLGLARTALEKDLPAEALKMVELAGRYFPDNPFLQLQKADLLAGLGQPRAATRLLDKLKRLTWSPVYYPYITSKINAQFKALKHPSADKQPADHRIKKKTGADTEPQR